MTALPEPLWEGLGVLGAGTARATTLGEVRPSRRTVSLYADPLSWLVLEAVERAMDDAKRPSLPERRDMGHLVVSDICTLHTMRELAGGIPDGRMSPLRFAGANPGQVCGLSSMLFGLNGPSMVLSMPPAEGVRPALTILRGWLSEALATAVILSLHHVDPMGHNVSSTILSRPGDHESI